MASADLVKELECCICLNIYTDPRMLKCGHNFCRECINSVLDTQERSVGYSCPQCREEFSERPALHRNLTLRNILENLASTQSGQEISGKVCTYCIHFPVLAVKSCLLCEAHLCDNHLLAHSKSREHVLCDPTTSLENRKCPIHKEQLKYYCTKDAACICVSCSLVGKHRGHQVETLEVASEMKQKTLRNVLQILMVKTRETEKRVQSLQEHQRKVQGKADGETKRATALFRDLRRQLEDLEKRVQSKISRQAEQISSSLSNLIRQLEIKKGELSKKMGHIQKLCNKTDPMTILQESDKGDLCNPEIGERHDKLHHGGWDLDVVEISQILHTGLTDIMSGILVQKCTDTHVYPHASTAKKARIAAEVSGPCTKPADTVHASHHQVGGPNIGVKQQTSGLLGVTGIFLDVNTAHNNLEISDDRKTASRSNIRQTRPNITERFQYHSHVLSSQSFSSGRHYWEVDVGGSNSWRVGMCYPSMDRKGSQSMIGDNNKSWGFYRKNNVYSVIHDCKEIQLPDNISSDRVRICLNYEAGQISFYSLCDTVRHLHTFNATFTEPLHAALGVWNGSVKLCGGSSS